ncbi:hypothetical protein FQN60_009128, partial [Etheostoma spectabile]
RLVSQIPDIGEELCLPSNINGFVQLQRVPSCPSSTMGKKSRVKTQKSGSGAIAVVSPKETMNLISELLQKCSSAAPSAGKEWEEYIQIRGLVEKICKKQKGMSIVFEGSREDYFPDLMSWAQENGASCDSFTVANFGSEGYGLQATRDIKEYDTPLYYQQDEVQVLLGTQAVQDVLNQYKNTARQYAYFYKLVQTHPAASKLPLKDSFTFEDYRMKPSTQTTLTYYSKKGLVLEQGNEASFNFFEEIFPNLKAEAEQDQPSTSSSTMERDTGSDQEEEDATMIPEVTEPDLKPI